MGPAWLALLLAGLIACADAARVAPPLLLSAAAGVLYPGDADCTPTQVHLALGKDATEMHVSWRTDSSNCRSEVTYQQLRYASQQDRQEQQQDQSPVTAGEPGAENVVGYSFLLSERDMCSEPAASNDFTLYLHRAVMKGLEPGSEYRYSIAGAGRAVRFRAAPAPSPDARFTFIGFGDMGDATHAAAKSPGASSTLLRLRQEVDAAQSPADLMLHVGDISYADGEPDIWASFMAGLQPVASRVPYMVASGNHDYGYTQGSGAVSDPSGADGPYQPSWGNFGSDSRGECGVMMARLFHMPRVAPSDNPPFWYSFDYGSVHFAAISTEHSVEPGSRQHRWLEADLAGVDRCTTPWLVVLMHRPMYVVYPHKSNRDVGEHIRDSIEDLLLQHKVDATLSGHVHSYYRTCPVADEDCIPGAGYEADAGASGSSSSSSSSGGNSLGCSGPAGSAGNRCRHGIVHFVVGSAGRKLSEVETGQEEWCAAKRREWGYGRFTVEGRDRLLAEFVSSETGEVLDATTVWGTAARDTACQRR